MIGIDGVSRTSQEQSFFRRVFSSSAEQQLNLQVKFVLSNGVTM